MLRQPQLFSRLFEKKQTFGQRRVFLSYLVTDLNLLAVHLKIARILSPHSLLRLDYVSAVSGLIVTGGFSCPCPILVCFSSLLRCQKKPIPRLYKLPSSFDSDGSRLSCCYFALSQHRFFVYSDVGEMCNALYSLLHQTSLAASG